MRHLVIYWEQDSNDLHLLDDVATMCCGNDGHEFLTSDAEAERVREIVSENPDKLTLETDTDATSWSVGLAYEFYGYANPREADTVDIQTVCQILGLDDYSEITDIIEAELTDADCRAWHAGELTENVERLVNTFGEFQVWGVKNPQGGEEPLSVIWSA